MADGARLDSLLLPAVRPRVLTAHGWLREEAWRERPGRGLRRLWDRMDAIVTLSEYGARRLRDQAGIPAERVRVIPHGAFDYLTRPSGRRCRCRTSWPPSRAP